jgi:hypothetical protein
MKRKSFDLDKLCLDYLDEFDGRTGPRLLSKSERARTGITLDCLLAERYSPHFASHVAEKMRKGNRTEALRILHSRLKEDLED